MALHWGLGDIQDWQELKPCINPEAPEKEREYKLNDFTERLIFCSMSLGFSKITKKNVEKIFTRNQFCIKLGLSFGTHKYEWIEEEEKYLKLEPTLDDFKRHIGLWTNASTLTPAQFKKRVMEAYHRINGDF